MFFSPQILGSGVKGNSVAANNFLARTSGQSGLYISAYQALLNGLTKDRVV